MFSTRHNMQILLLTDKTHPAFHMRKYVFHFYVSIRSKSVSKITKEDWEKAEKEHPEKISSILQELAQSYPSFLFNFAKEILKHIYPYIALNIS